MKIKDILNPNRPITAKRLIKQLSEWAERDATNRLEEGRKYIEVSNHERIGIDQPHAPNQEVHAHLENGRAVTKSGKRSHGGEPFTLSRAQAAALRKANFKIPDNRLIESEGQPKATVRLDPALIELLNELKKSLG